MFASAQLTPSRIASDFVAVDLEIHRQLASDVNLIEHIAKHIIDSGGKRLRPLLVLLIARALNYQGEKHIILASLIEFMHTSTLLHDDVVDESALRRKKPTANALWGNAASVLVGDFLYSRSFQMMVAIGSMPIMNVLSAATCKIAEGEVKQLSNIGNPDINEAAYFATIDGKTAQLFEAATHCAALLCGANSVQTEALRLYGHYLGLSFQLIDDYLDYQGDSELMGKNVGDDLAEGKPTLPLIRAMQVAETDNVLQIRHAIEQGSIDNLSKIQSIIKETGALEYTREKALEMSDLALNQLSVLTSSEFRDALIALTQRSLGRSD